MRGLFLEGWGIGLVYVRVGLLNIIRLVGLRRFFGAYARIHRRRCFLGVFLRRVRRSVSFVRSS